MKQPKLNDLLQSFVKVCVKSHKGLLLGLWHPGVKGGGREARARTPLRKRKTTLGSWGGKRSKEWEDGSLRLRQILVWLCLVAQLCPTLCDPMDYSPLGSSVHEILQARILKWLAMPSSRGSSQPRDWTQVSCLVGWFFIVWVTRQAS